MPRAPRELRQGRYEEIDRRDFQDRDLDAQGRMQRLVLKAGIDLELSRIQWCDAVLTELRSQGD